MKLEVGHTYMLDLWENQAMEYVVTVDPKQVNFSSFVFQVHAERYNLTLTNTSSSCTSPRECATNGNVAISSRMYVCVCKH